jgi:hypothetical protein
VWSRTCLTVQILMSVNAHIIQIDAPLRKDRSSHHHIYACITVSHIANFHCNFRDLSGYEASRRTEINLSENARPAKLHRRRL